MGMSDGRIDIHEVGERTPELIDRLVQVWEASVKATHLFLSPSEISQIKAYVPQALQGVEYLVVATEDAGELDFADSSVDGAQTDGMQTDDKAAGGVRVDDPANGKGILGNPVAFMGVNPPMLEMLFVAPDQRGKGVGKHLIRYGIDHLGVTRLAVNEQNPQAKGFYEHMGFTVYKRTDHDEQGQPYPLLYMRLEG
jgi:putative acetyltransferase